MSAARIQPISFSAGIFLATASIFLAAKNSAASSGFMSAGIVSSIFAGFTMKGMFRNFKIFCRLGEEEANIIGSIMFFFQLTF